MPIHRFYGTILRCSNEKDFSSFCSVSINIGAFNNSGSFLHRRYFQPCQFKLDNEFGHHP